MGILVVFSKLFCFDDSKVWRSVQPSEGEVLFRGDISATAVESGATRGLRYAGRGLQIFGAVVAAKDVGKATAKSYIASSPKPIVAETIRQAGSWGAAWAGAKGGAALGAAAGVETGPGAVLTGLLGGIIGGIGGYWAADTVADTTDQN
jgi:hypothetical protein